MEELKITKKESKSFNSQNGCHSSYKGYTKTSKSLVASPSITTLRSKETKTFPLGL